MSATRRACATIASSRWPAATPSGRSARAAAWGVAAETPDRLLARDDIDIILNLTPPAAHYATTMAALKAGKHVFCEKTLAATLEEAARAGRDGRTRAVSGSAWPPTQSWALVCRRPAP